jgi:hypothetical protein
MSCTIVGCPIQAIYGLAVKPRKPIYCSKHRPKRSELRTINCLLKWCQSDECFKNATCGRSIYSGYRDATHCRIHCPDDSWRISDRKCGDRTTGRCEFVAIYSEDGSKTNINRCILHKQDGDILSTAITPAMFEYIATHTPGATPIEPEKVDVEKVEKIDVEKDEKVEGEKPEEIKLEKPENLKLEKVENSKLEKPEEIKNIFINPRQVDAFMKNVVWAPGEESERAIAKLITRAEFLDGLFRAMKTGLGARTPTCPPKDLAKKRAQFMETFGSYDKIRPMIIHAIIAKDKDACMRYLAAKVTKLVEHDEDGAGFEVEFIVACDNHPPFARFIELASEYVTNIRRKRESG